MSPPWGGRVGQLWEHHLQLSFFVLTYCRQPEEEQLNKGILRYLLGRESLSTGFHESRLSEESVISGYFKEKAYRKTYAGIPDLKNLKKATTTLTYSAPDDADTGIIWFWIGIHNEYEILLKKL